MAQDPKDPYAAIAKPIDDPYASIATPIAAAPTKGYLDQLADWGNRTFANTPSRFSAQHPATSPEDVMGEIGRPGENMVKAGIRTFTGLPAAIADAGQSIIHPIDAFKKSAAHFTQEDVGQPQYKNFSDAAKSITPGELEQNVTDVGGSLLAADAMGRMVGGVAKIPGKIKMAARGDINAPMIGSNTTPLQRYESAKNLGVNLDAADATNSPFLNSVKRLNEHSLLGGTSYDKLKAGNTTALRGSTDDFLNGMYAGDRESGGLAIQNALKANQARLHRDATAGFKSLPQDYPLAASPDLGKFAQSLGDEQKSYYSQFPSLQPTKALNVIGDVGGLAPKPVSSPKMGAFGMLQDAAGITPPPVPMGSPAPANFGTIQRLRSDLLDFNRNNTDVVKNQSGGWLQQLAARSDDTMTDGAKGLPPAQQQAFRDANAKWEDMKRTYDDMNSPFYSAVRTPTPSTLYGGVGGKTAENALNLKNRLAPEGVPNDALGAVRRGTIESALKTTNDGSPNFRTFGTQWNGMPADYRASLYDLPQNEMLKDIVNTSNVLGKDFNPSGSGKHVQKFVEGAALGGALVNPLAAIEPAMQYPVAKAMTNPRAVEWLMAPQAPSNPFLAPGATAATLAANPASPTRNNAESTKNSDGSSLGVRQQQLNPNMISPSFQGKIPPGMTQPGNVDLTNRPNIKNADGSHSSVFSMGFNVDGKEVLVPGVGDGKTYPLRKLSETEALDQYKRTGNNLGRFADADSSDAYAKTLHEDQGRGNKESR